MVGWTTGHLGLTRGKAPAVTREGPAYTGAFTLTLVMGINHESKQHLINGGLLPLCHVRQDGAAHHVADAVGAG